MVKISRIKILSFLFISFFIFIYLIIPFTQDYYDFHKQKIELKVKQNILKEELKDFSLEKIKILDNTKIFYSLSRNPSPFRDSLWKREKKNKNDISKKIIEKINKAEKNIFIEVYLFTHKNIRQAVLQAKKRWVLVKIILEKNIYKSANLNLKTFFELQKAWINVVWSNPKNFKLNHSKIIIIDDELILSTWNLTYSTFSKNTDFFVFTKNFNIVEKFKQIFLNDFEGKKDFVYDHNIVLSPNYTKEKFDFLLNSCQKSLKIYIPSIWDKFLKKIIELKKKNINIEIIFWNRKTNLENIERLKKVSIKVKIKDNIHAKAFLIDEKILFIWSINFNINSITKNREMWILLKNPEIIKKFLEIFKKDFLEEKS